MTTAPEAATPAAPKFKVGDRVQDVSARPRYRLGEITALLPNEMAAVHWHSGSSGTVPLSVLRPETAIGRS